MKCIKRRSLFFLIYVVATSQVSEPCTTNGGLAGYCTNIRSCPAAIAGLRNKSTPKLCGFEGADPVVCCETGFSAEPILDTTTQKPTFQNNDKPSKDVHTGGCEPIPHKKTGKKAWDKCLEYYEQLVNPCMKNHLLNNSEARVGRCPHPPHLLIAGGNIPTPQEFPHMALLGFGDNPQAAQFLCAGSIISEKYILTAGHCTLHREFGNISYAVLGAYKRSQTVDPNRLYRIKRIVKHPDFKPPRKYNDIALLELERPIPLDEHTIPACLPREEGNITKAFAVGWADAMPGDSDADSMQKLELYKYNETECQKHFPANRLIVNGINETTQLCYGDKPPANSFKCQGDSGGPLQIAHQQLVCMYSVVGVTTVGHCGLLGHPGVYTRVAPFVNWIESVVWA